MKRKYIKILLPALTVMLACSGPVTKTGDDTDSINNTDTACVETKNDDIPPFAQKLIKCYPESIVGYENDSIVFSDGSKMVYDDGVVRSDLEILDNCDIEDMSRWPYIDSVIAFRDPGRNRCEALFRKIYGNSAAEVSKNLTTIVWCPNVVGQRVQVTTVGGVHKQLKKVSDELDKHPEWKEYLKSSGTMNWRVVAGTNRLSPHSFAIAIDIGVSKSNYWRWDNANAKESDTISYHNKMLKEIVAIFKKHGFIWGGNWYHYDTMHFEYRPELIED